MFGGGRYDGLTRIFGAENLPVVGTAPGLTATENFIVSHRLMPTLGSKTELCLIVLGEESIEDSLVLADQLRDEGVRVVGMEAAAVSYPGFLRDLGRLR